VGRSFLRFALGERKKRPTGQTKEKTMEYHSNNTSSSNGSAAVHAASGNNNRKPATAQQLIRENVQFLIEQLEAGHSEALTTFLDAMAHFHAYSFRNVLLIARQNPQATRVAGMFTWNQLERRVKRGEKGIAILAPMIGKRCKKQNSEAGTEKDANRHRVRYKWHPRFGSSLHGTKSDTSARFGFAIRISKASRSQ
jgi:hypothetical protein